MKNCFHIIYIFLYCCSVNAQQIVEIPEVSSYKRIASDVAGGPTLTGVNFGRSVATIGDLNNDGILDIAVGAPGENSSQGAVYICFMNSSDEVASSVKIQSSSIGSVLNNSDLFGSSVTGIGDIDGDGNEDIAVGAPGDDAGGLTDCGAVYVIQLSSSAAVNNCTAIGNALSGGITSLNNGGNFGNSITDLGDIDADGIHDLAVGAQLVNGLGTQRGAVYTLRINSTGAVKSSGASFTLIGDNAGGISSGVLANSDFFGSSVAGAGDLNADGQPDIIVGASGEDNGYTNAGAFYVLYLTNTGSVTGSPKLLDYEFMSNYHFPFYTGVNFGSSLGLADMNGDGIKDILAGTSTFNSNKGAVHVLTLDASEDITGMRTIGFNYAWNYSGPATAPQFGVSVANITESGAMRTKLLVGAHVHNGGSSNQGSFYMVTMDSLTYNFPLGTVRDFVKIGDFSGTFTGTLADNDFFSLDGACIGDLNNDGYKDLVIGAEGDNTGGGDAGAGYVVFLDSRGKANSFAKIAQGTTNFGSPLAASDFFGWAVAPLGDWDNDGVEDVLIGAAGDDDGGSNRGAVYLICLNSGGTVKSTTKISHGGNLSLLDTDFFGVDVDTIGDLNNDGVMDLVVGAYQNDDIASGSTSTTNRGAVYIVYLRSNGTVKRCAAISDTRGGFNETFANGDLFGFSVDGIGDFNGDGIEDIAVGSLLTNGTGAAYLIYLDTAGAVIDYKKINNAANNFPYTIASGQSFGNSVQMIPDIDGNGVRDLMIGTNGKSSYGILRGGTWITLLDESANVLDAILVSDSAGKFYPTCSTTGSERLAYCVRYIDTDADGNIRVMLGSSSDEGGTGRGAAYITVITAGINARPSGNYAALKRKPDAGVVVPSNGYVKFIYDEEYQVGSSKKLQYKLYKGDHDLIGEVDETGAAIIPGSPLIPVEYGKNKIMVNFNPLGLSSDFYLLEVTTAKNEKRYLKFRK